MTEPFEFHYLTYDEVLGLHRSSVLRWGGCEGLRDKGALESSVAMPTTLVFGVERFPTLEAKAAAYCWFIARNHPFVDGNKRTALAAAFVFLVVNGVIPRFHPDEAYAIVNRTAGGQCALEELTAFFTSAAQPASGGNCSAF